MAAPKQPAPTPSSPQPPTTPTTPRSPTNRPPISLQQPSNRKGPTKTTRLFRRFRSVFKSFPIITPACKIPVLQGHHGGNSRLHEGTHIHGGTRLTGTLFGHRKGRISLVIQENPKCIPMVLIELGIPTGKLLQDMGLGMVRIAMECEKQNGGGGGGASFDQHKTKLMDEPIWTLFCNGRKTGYGVKREPTAEDLNVMQMLSAVSMGAGVLPADEETEESPDGEMTYMRAFFERVVGSKDSETYYMMNPDGNNGPELSIFFVRI